MTPLQLFTYQTPNGHKVSIMLEETGLPYDVHVVDIEKGEQHNPEFLALNPNNKIPVIVDPDEQRTVFESGAILHYLAERSGMFAPQTARLASETLTWMFFQAAHVGPALGQLWNYKIFASEKLPQVIGRFETESARIFRVLNTRLAAQKYLVGDAYGLADMMTWPWIHVGVEILQVSLDEVPRLRAWYDEIKTRPAVVRGLSVPALDVHDSSEPHPAR